MGNDTSLQMKRFRYSGTLIVPKIIHIALLLGARGILDLAYIKVVAPNWGHGGFVCEPDPAKIIESYMITLVLGAMLPHSLRRPSDYLVTVLFMMPIMPALSLYGLQGNPRTFTYMMAICLVVVMVTRHFRPRIPALAGRGTALGSAVCMVIVGLSLAERVATGRLQYLNFDMGAVYAYRRAVEALSSNRVFSYVHTWAQNVANPALLTRSLQVGKHWAFAALVGVQLVLFGTSAARSVLFYPLLVLAVFWVSHKRYALHLTVLGLSLAVTASCAMVLSLGDLMPVSLFVRRVMFVPAWLNYVYYEYFASAGYVCWSNSVLGPLLRYTFGLPPALLISDYLKGDTLTWMNTSFLGAGYMHLGFLGMIIYSVIIGLLMGLVDAITANRVTVPFAVATVIVPFFVLFTSADLPTALLTHGVALSVMLLGLFSASQATEKRDH